MQPPSSISRILFSSPDFIIDKNKAGLSGLKPNQIIDAKVTKILSDGKAQLLIKGESVTAKTHVVLKENEVVKLKVVSDGDTKVLRLVKNDTGLVMPEGLKEMRAFGRSGLYSKLTQILSEYTQTDKGSSVKTLPQVQTALAESPLKTDIPKEGIQKNSGVKSGLVVKISSDDLANLKLFLNNKSIPFPQKVSALLTSVQTEQAVVPKKIMDRLAEKLLLTINKGTEPVNKLPVMDRLVESVKTFRNTLPAKTVALVDKVLDSRTLPFEYKLLSTLTTKKNAPFSKASTAVQKFLLKGLESKGFNLAVEMPAGVVPEAIHTGKRASVVRQLETLLDTVSLNPDKMPDDESLKAIVRSTGLMWESKVKSGLAALKESQMPPDMENLINSDVKSLAMKLASVMEGEDRNAANTLRSFVDGLEKMQLLNRHSFDESGRYLLPLPFFSDETLKFGQLLVDLDRDASRPDDNKSRAVRVALILEMSKLGHLKADFAIYKKSVSGTFGVENVEVQTFIKGLLSGLTETLAEKGYIVKKIGCEVISSGELAGASLTDMVIDNTDGLLNIVV